MSDTKMKLTSVSVQKPTVWVDWDRTEANMGVGEKLAELIEECGGESVGGGTLLGQEVAHRDEQIEFESLEKAEEFHERLKREFDVEGDTDEEEGGGVDENVTKH